MNTLLMCMYERHVRAWSSLRSDPLKLGLQMVCEPLCGRKGLNPGRAASECSYWAISPAPGRCSRAKPTVSSVTHGQVVISCVDKVAGGANTVAGPYFSSCVGFPRWWTVWPVSQINLFLPQIVFNIGVLPQQQRSKWEHWSSSMCCGLQIEAAASMLYCTMVLLHNVSTFP